MTPEEQSIWDRALCASLTGFSTAQGITMADDSNKALSASEVAHCAAMAADAAVEQYRKRRNDQ